MQWYMYVHSIKSDITLCSTLCTFEITVLLGFMIKYVETKNILLV